MVIIMVIMQISLNNSTCVTGHVSLSPVITLLSFQMVLYKTAAFSGGGIGPSLTHFIKRVRAYGIRYDAV